MTTQILNDNDVKKKIYYHQIFENMKFDIALINNIIRYVSRYFIS